ADGSSLTGGILVGHASQYNMLLQTVASALPAPEDPEELILGSKGTNAASQAAGLGMLPESAIICSCEGVTKGRLIEAIGEGCETFDALKTCTKAGTGCSGCVPLVKDILADTRKKQGKYIRKSVSEHFPISRQG